MAKMIQDNENREIITGSDFKRMVQGAYSEFLLEFENINALDRRLRPGHNSVPGTNILRTMGAAAMPLMDNNAPMIAGAVTFLLKNSAPMNGTNTTLKAVRKAFFEGVV